MPLSSGLPIICAPSFLKSKPSLPFLLCGRVSSFELAWLRFSPSYCKMI